MEVIKPGNNPIVKKFVPRLFLAGGVTNCKNWQDDVIDRLEYYKKIYDIDNLRIFNPRRNEFDISDRDATVEQIEWEHRWLMDCNIVSFFFDNGESLQPITLYELGKWSSRKPCIITITKGYAREADVLIQTALDGLKCQLVNENEAIEAHALAIAQAVNGGDWR